MKLIDLTGNRYGKLVVRQYLGNGSWLCDCDCGNTATVKGKYLRTGGTKSCGCLYENGRRVPKYDLVGERFGKLTVLKYDEMKSGNWICQCDCGNTVSVSKSNLKSGMTKSCGCLRHDSRNVEDLAGQKFGRLTALEYVGKSKWRCVCECGNETIVNAHHLKSGGIKSCGCLVGEKARARMTKHGLSDCRLYGVWQGMKGRCYRERDEHYDYYGGRGIKVCPEWKDDFKAFYDWAVANGYKEDGIGHECTLDRIDSDGDYTPENCRWATLTEQMSNRRPYKNPSFYKPVELISEDGTVLQRFESIKSAASATGCTSSGIVGVCKGNHRKHRGMIFRYANVDGVNV